MRFALRELRAGLGGFYVFIACVALGVAVISGVAMLGASLKAGFEAQGRAIVGGDIALARIHQRASDDERRWLAAHGGTSETATLRAMARPLAGADQTLVEIKAVDSGYPLVGEVILNEGGSLVQAVALSRAAVAPILLSRLGLQLGDKIRIGDAEIEFAATIASEPDTISDRITYGPRVLISLSTLEATHLVQPGTLVRWRYAVDLPDRSAAAIEDTRAALRRDLPEAGFLVTDRRDPSPQVTRTLDRLGQFLTLLGITALVVGGVGVANAVATFIDRKRKTIAAFRSLGAAGATVFAVFAAQVFVITSIGVAIGLALGALLPFLLNAAFADALPVRAVLRPNLPGLAAAAAYGYLVACAFALWPLGRAERIRPASLLRNDLGTDRVWPRWPVIAGIAAAVVALAALAVMTSDSRRIALYYGAAQIVVLVLFAALGIAAGWIARRLPRPRIAELAIAQASIGAPDGLTRAVVLSLGTGLSLLVAVALVDASLMAELTTKIPVDSPDYFVLDIPKADFANFERVVRTEAPDAVIAAAPMLRGRMVRLNNVAVEDIKDLGDAQWVLNGDRGLTFAQRVPDGSSVIAGEWWPDDYAGPPLVSFEKELAGRLHLKLGDTVTVNVLGRNVTARIANLRDVKWENLSINFVMVFSPNTLQAAPYNMLATVKLRRASLADEIRVDRAIGAGLPSVTTIRVKEAIEAFEGVFARVMSAVRVAGSVTLLAGALVLAGALATAQRRRILEAAILKALGATRRRIMAAHLLEYALLAVLAGGLAVVLGSAAAWVALTRVMDVAFVFSLPAVGAALGLALLLVLGFGAVGSFTILRGRPATYLRSE